MNPVPRLAVVSVLLLASLAAAGCLERAPVKTFPAPLQGEEDSTGGGAGNWTYTLSPTTLTGRPGDVRNFTLAVTPAANATPRQAYLVPPQWMQVQGNRSDRQNLTIPPGGRVFTLEVVLGAAATTNLSILEPGANPTPVQGPAVTLTGTTLPVAGVNATTGNTTRPGGLQVARTATGVRATYTLGEANASCNLAYGPEGRFLVLQEGAGAVLVGFVDYEMTDACVAGPGPRDWLTAEAAAPNNTGPIERVVLYTSVRGCFCFPVHRGVTWDRTEARLD